MILTTKTTIKWSHIKEQYIKKGYIFTKIGDIFEVDVKDLSTGSSALVSIKCDYCGEVAERRYSAYIRNRLNFPKDCCGNSECMTSKRSESNFFRTGVEHPMQREEVKEKIKKTNLKKYGVENVFSNEDTKKKIAITNIEKFGFENPFQSEEIKEKIKASNLKNFGYSYPMQSEDIREKSYISRAKNNPYDFSKMFPIINGVAASKPQIELGAFLNGKINERISKKTVDILLEDAKTVIEYDGGGHTLDVKTGRVTEESFYKKEKETQERIIKDGWKFIRVSNPKDKKMDFISIKRQVEEFLLHNEKYLLIKVS